MPTSARTLAHATLIASGSSLPLLLTPWPPARYAGAVLGASGILCAAWLAHRLHTQHAAPALFNPVVEAVAQPQTDLAPEVWLQVGRLHQDCVVATVAQQEVDTLLGDVSTNAAELLRATTSVRTMMEQVERSVANIEAGSRDQAQRLSEAAGHAADSAQVAGRIAREAANLTAGARETAVAARSGARLLEEAGTAVTAMGVVVEQSNTAMERLAGLSSQIGALVDGIGGIAKQSNLLALNAAIEAARAGTQGRSFAVVAESMRELATQAATAAAEAGRLVHQVQGETQTASLAVAAGGAQVAASTQLMERVVTDLKAILERAAGIEGGMAAISEHAAAADEAARRLAGQITAVAAVSEETTAEAESMGESSREATASIKAIAHVSRHYAQMPEAVHASLTPLRRSVQEAGALAAGLEGLSPLEGAHSSGEVRYADWQPWENCLQWWKLDRFQTAHPAIRVKHLHLVNSEFSGQLALPEVPDVTWAAPDWAPQLLQPIDDLLEADRFDLSSFVPGVVESLRRLGGGRTYGLPMHLNMPLMVYNKNLFDRAGVPHPRPGMTWEELLPALERIRERTGAHGLEIDMRNAHFLPFALHFLAPVGAQLMDDAGQRINRSAAVEAKLQFLYDLGRKGTLLPYEQLWAPVRPFVKGEVAVLIGSTATLLFTPIREMAARRELNFVPEVAAHPTFASHPGVAPAANFHLIGLHRFARDRRAAWELLKHLVTDQERIRGDILRWGQAPVQYDDGVRAAYAELGRQGAPTQYQTLWSLRTAPLPPYILTPGFRRLETVAGHEMALLMAGQKRPADLLASLVAAMERS